MANGIASLRRYQTGGGVGDPGDDWLKKLIRELQKRANIKGLPDDPSMMRFFPNLDADDLIHLSNFDIEYDGDKKQRMGLGPKPHVVPPLSNTPDLGNVLDDVDKSLDNLSSVIDKFLRNVMGLSEWEIAQWHADNTPDLSGETLDQPVHDLDEAFRNNQVDDLIRGAGGEPPLSAALQREADIASLAESDIWNVDDRYKSKLPAYSSFDSPHRSGIGSLLNRLTSSSIPWGSIAAPLLAAAASPAALAAETAFDFAISPESLGGTASEVPGAGRTWRESPHIDPSDEEVASFMQTLLGDSPYSQSQLARPSTTSQRAIEELIRRAQAGTPVNRYRR